MFEHPCREIRQRLYKGLLQEGGIVEDDRKKLVSDEDNWRGAKANVKKRKRLIK